MAGYLVLCSTIHFVYVAGGGTNQNVIKKVDGSGDMAINSTYGIYTLTLGRKIRSIVESGDYIYVTCEEDESGSKEPKVIRVSKDVLGETETELALPAIGGKNAEEAGECQISGTDLYVGGSVLDGSDKDAALWKIALATFTVSDSEKYTNFTTNRVYQDFQIFTAVDPDSRFTLWNHNLIGFNAKTNEDSYFYYNYGSAHFGNFTHKLQIRVASTPDDGAKGYVWMLANAINDAKGIHDASGTFIGVYFYRTGSDYRIVLHEDHSGNEYEDYYETTSGMLGGDYYLKITKSGTGLTCIIYDTQSDLDNAANAIDTLTLVLQADHSFQYLYAANTYNDGVARTCNLSIISLDIAELDYNGKISVLNIESGAHPYVHALTENGMCLKLNLDLSLTTHGGPEGDECSGDGTEIVVPLGLHAPAQTINYESIWEDIHWVTKCTLKHVIKIRAGRPECMWGMERNLADSDDDWTMFSCAAGGDSNLKLYIGAGNCNELKKVELDLDMSVEFTLTLSTGTNGLNGMHISS